MTSTTKNGAELSAYEYAYSDGNLSRVTDNESGLTTVYTDDAVKIYAVWKDKLASYDGNVINYDQVGNPTNYVSKDLAKYNIAGALEYDGRQLVKATNGSDGYNYQYVHL